MTFDRAYVESWIADVVAEVRARHGLDPGASDVTREKIEAFDADLKRELEERGQAARVEVEAIEHGT